MASQCFGFQDNSYTGRQAKEINGGIHEIGKGGICNNSKTAKTRTK